MTDPYVSGAGIFHTKVTKYKKGDFTPQRTVTEYEFELFSDDYDHGFINDKFFEFKRNTLLVAKPGDIRRSTIHFSCNYIHVTIKNNELKKAIASLPSIIKTNSFRDYHKIFKIIMH